MKTRFLVAIVGILAITLASCSDRDQSNSPSAYVAEGKTVVPTPEGERAPVSNTFGAVDYGQGVFYFPCTGKQFGTALSSFLHENESLEVSSVANDIVAEMTGTDSAYSHNVGYFVTFRKKQK